MTTSFHHVGFGFRPTDEELVNHYLKNKLLGNDSIVSNVMAEVDVCKFEPWELPAVSVMKSDDPEWFFLCPLNYKYPNNKKFKRKTNCGFWKATGKDRNIKIRGTNKVIGIKKTLVYKSHVPGVKTNWVIHEYHDVTMEDHQRTFALCRLMKKKVENNAHEETNTMIYDEGGSSNHMSSNNENEETIGNVSGTLPEVNMEPIFPAPYQAENYYPFSTQQSSISENEPEVLIPNLQFHNGNVNLDYQSSFEGASFETPEEADLFVNSMLIDGEIDY